MIDSVTRQQGETMAGPAPKTRDWRALESWWESHLGTLAAEIALGHAAVAPRATPLPCKNCGLQTVCRIESVRGVQDDELADE